MQPKNISKNQDFRLLGILLTPSWLSGTVAVTAGIGLAVATIVAAHLRGSYTELQFLNYRLDQAHKGMIASYSGQSTGSTTSKLIANLPLLLFWMLVGAVVYMLAASVVRAFQDAGAIKTELDNYTNLDRNSLLKTAAVHFGIRLAVIAVWLPYILFFFHHVLPYCLVTALASASSPLSLNGLEYAFIAAAVMALAVHLHVILFRLLLLKPRIFSQALYVD